MSSKVGLIFFGDFNIHVDDLNDPNFFHFFKLLKTFHLCKHVSFPSDNSGHILNLIGTNALPNLFY